jgi:hypothetical protein
MNETKVDKMYDREIEAPSWRVVGQLNAKMKVKRDLFENNFVDSCF